eukprot:Seg1644.8 transcript_id=Seg1644.8/GoldUCD/mRNA.D3Y31 product="hypothetical protein" protein_id=Seg1644.8/GoldUCD/D3Y31
MASQQRPKSNTKYPDKLMQHLRSFEDANGTDKSVLELVQSWKFIRSEDTGEAESVCPCGKVGIRYLMFIEHKVSHQETHVGSECIKIFEEKLQKVMQVADRLLRTGLKGTFKGVTKGVKNPKLRFQINSQHGLVKEIDNFSLYFDREKIPVFHKTRSKNKHWECAIFPGNFPAVSSSSYAEEAELVDGNSYELKLSLKRWAARDGEGFSLYIITLERK